MKRDGRPRGRPERRAGAVANSPRILLFINSLCNFHRQDTISNHVIYMQTESRAEWEMDIAATNCNIFAANGTVLSDQNHASGTLSFGRPTNPRIMTVTMGS